MKSPRTRIAAKHNRYRALVLISMAAGIIGLSFSQTQAPPIFISIVCDDHPFRRGFEAGRGFSCLIQGTEKTVLFDTGGQDSNVLFHNLAALKAGPGDVDIIVISRDRPGQIGGLLPFLAKKGECQVFLPASISPDLVKQVEAANGKVVHVTNPVSVCEGVYSTGLMSSEQSLVVDTPKGLVILAGCAQAGIVDVVEKARSVMPKDIFLLMGGFELDEKNIALLGPIVSRLREQGVKNLGATRCTGEKTIAFFKREFGRSYLALGAGKTIVIQ